MIIPGGQFRQEKSHTPRDFPLPRFPDDRWQPAFYCGMAVMETRLASPAASASVP